METKGLIFKKMNEVMKEIGAVSKDQFNKMQGFKFRGIDQFVNALYPALCKSGVFMVPECVERTHEIREVQNGDRVRIDKHVHLLMKYHFFAEDGSCVTVGPIPAEGLDTGDKATNTTLSAALKYALIQTFCVPTEDMADGDSESPEIGKKVMPPFVTSKKTVKEEPKVVSPPVAVATAVVAPKVETPPVAQPPVAQKPEEKAPVEPTPEPPKEETKVASTKPTFKKPSTKAPGW